jgi:Domain of unknown function (DUF4150)
MSSCDVFANDDEIACKAGGGKVIACFPDVCLSPPSPPAGPVPIPYPDTSFSKDMQSGSKTVLIKDKEVMLKDQSFYKSSPLGDEAATNGLGANVVTHVITGKTYFVAWSMDVQFEGQNIDRHLDQTTSNHASAPPGTPPGPNVGWASTAKSQAKSGKCNCCKGNEHVKTATSTPPGTAKAMSMDSYYTTDDSGAPLPKNHPKVVAYKKLRKDMKNKKKLSPPCTCDKRTEPKSPCNVFYKKPTPTEYNLIKNTARGPGWFTYKQGLGLPASPPVQTAANTVKATCLAQDGITQTAGEIADEPNLEKRGNHLVPKQAGGCPMGKNVELEHDLCGRCRSFEYRIGKIQGM